MARRLKVKTRKKIKEKRLRLYGFLFKVLSCFILLFLIGTFVISEIHNRFLKIENIVFVGLTDNEIKQISQQLPVKHGDNILKIFFVSFDKILNKFPVIKKIKPIVKQRKLILEFQKRVPIFYYKTRDDIWLVCSDGVKYKHDEVDISSLPNVTSEPDIPTIVNLVKRLKTLGLKNISDIEYTPININCKIDGIIVNFGCNRLDEKLKFLKDFFVNLNSQKIPINDIKAIDFSLYDDGRVIIKRSL